MVEPSEYIGFDRSDLEEHSQALLEIALKLLEQDSEFEKRCRRRLFNEPLNDLSAQIILVPLDQAKDQVLILLHQVRIGVVSAVFDLASRLRLRNQSLELLLIELQKLLVEQNLLRDGAQAQLLRDENLRLLAH